MLAKQPDGRRRSQAAAALTLTLLLAVSAGAPSAWGQTPDPPTGGVGGLLRLGEMAQAAMEVRKTAEAIDRIASPLLQLVQSISQALAAMSSEFDPLGHKSGYRVLGQQAEQQQRLNDKIQELQQREIDRLRRENRSLRRQLKRRRASQAE